MGMERIPTHLAKFQHPCPQPGPFIRRLTRISVRSSLPAVIWSDLALSGTWLVWVFILLIDITEVDIEVDELLGIPRSGGVLRPSHGYRRVIFGPV